MRITLVTETFFPQINGVSRTLDQLVRYLKRQGDEIQLLAPRYPEGEPESDALAQIHAYPAWQLPCYREIHLPFTRRKTLERHIAEFAPGVVHIATEGPLGFKALSAVRRLNLPLVTSYHTNFSHYMECYRLGFISGAFWKYLRWFHNLGMATLCPSNSIREILNDQGFDNVRVWGRGVDSDRFHPGKRSEDVRKKLGVQPDELLLTYAGRVANEKNLPMLLDAYLALPDTPKTRLLIIGDGPIRERLQSRADSRVLFPGYKRGEELSVLYAASDLFVFPSLTETFGNVMLEGMASGLPTVAYDVPGPKDVVQHGKTGILVESVTAEAMTAALADIIQSPATIRAMAKAARAHAQSQTWDAVNAVVRQAYLAALPNR